VVVGIEDQAKSSEKKSRFLQMAESNDVKRYRRLFGLFGAKISTGTAGDEVYNMPIFVRRDGVEVKVGQVVRRQRSKLLYLVREILLRGDLTGLDVVLSPVELRGDLARLMEEIVLASLEELLPLQQRLVSVELARDGMLKVSGRISRYPSHVQRTVRRHQLASLIRDSVQKFLAGFSLARTVSLGCVDWNFDPGILGLDRETDYSLEYKLEQYVDLSSHLDLVLGDQWDVRRVCGGEGWRVILTLEMKVDTRQQLKLETHGTTCQGELSPGYRRDSVAQSLHQSTTTHLSHLTVDRLESLHSIRGVSLVWEEFQDSRQLEETLEISNIETDIASALRSIEDGSSDNQQDKEGRNVNDNSYCEEIEETSAALKKLLDTPTKGFSQLVFNVTNKASGDNNNTVPYDTEEILISQVEAKTRHVKLSEELDDLDDEIPNLSPIKLFNNQSIVNADVHSTEFLSDFIGTRQTTSTPEGEDDGRHRNVAAAMANIVEHDQPTNDVDVGDILDNHTDEDDVFSEDYRVSSSNNLNHKTSDIHSEDNNSLKIPEYSSNKVRAYVESLPSPSQQSQSSKNQTDVVKEKRLLDESFDSETSSRSKVSKLSDISNLAGRFTNTGMFYGSALGGQQQVCPFPEEWQFQTIPESIENNEEID